MPKLLLPWLKALPGGLFPDASSASTQIKLFSEWSHRGARDGDIGVAARCSQGAFGKVAKTVRVAAQPSIHALAPLPAVHTRAPHLHSRLSSPPSPVALTLSLACGQPHFDKIDPLGSVGPRRWSSKGSGKRSAFFTHLPCSLRFLGRTGSTCVEGPQ